MKIKDLVARLQEFKPDDEIEILIDGDLAAISAHRVQYHPDDLDKDKQVVVIVAE